MTFKASRTRKNNNNATAMASLVQMGKDNFTLYFPGKEDLFDLDVWYVGDLKDRAVSTSNPRLYFTRFGSTSDPLPKMYAQVIKSWLVTDYRLGNRCAVQPLNAARILWDAILLRRRNRCAEFNWANFCDEDLNQAEILMRERWNQNTTYRCVSHLVGLARYAARRLITRPSYYVRQTTRVEDSNRHTIDGRERRKKLLPSDASLAGLAQIYRLASDPADQLLSAAIGITAAAGFRLGELLTLPHDCEFEELRDGKPRYGLRYYKEKNKEDEKLFAIRWLTPIQSELARDAISRIKSITAPYRERAKVLEANPNTVPIPDTTSAVLPAHQVNSLLGFKSPEQIYQLRSAKLRRHKVHGRLFFFRSDLESYLFDRRVRRLWTVDRRNGLKQMLSETLLLAPKNFFHSNRATSNLLIEPIYAQNIGDFLAGKPGVKSAFECFGLTESDGTSCRMTSHQLRYWLNDIADKGGLPVDTLTRWMGRENPRDTEAYRFETADEKCRRIKEGIRAGEIGGHISEVYFSLPEDERDIFLESQVASVHFTPMGICAHDYSLSPCERHLNCVRGTCPDYLRRKGNQTERANLMQIIKNTEISLKEARDKAAANNTGLATAWIKHHEDTIAGGKAALAIDDDSKIDDGAMIRPFRSQPKDHASILDLKTLVNATVEQGS